MEKHKDTVQVGDRVKYTNGALDYYVKLIHSCGKLCDIYRNNEYKKEYCAIPIFKLEVLDKNPKLLSHKEIEKFTLSSGHKETNPHKKLATHPIDKKPAKTKELDYLVTQYAPMVSIKYNTDNENIYSHKVVTGKDALATYIIELENEPIRYQREVRVLGREVRIDVKK